jgi:hypothetical protein
VTPDLDPEDFKPIALRELRRLSRSHQRAMRHPAGSNARKVALAKWGLKYRLLAGRAHTFRVTRAQLAEWAEEAGLAMIDEDVKEKARTEDQERFDAIDEAIAEAEAAENSAEQAPHRHQAEPAT